MATYISHAGNYSEIAAAEIFYLAPVLQGRNDQRGDAAKYEHQTEVARRVGKAGVAPRRANLPMRSKNWTIVKPNPISEAAVRTHAISVRSIGEPRTQPSKMIGRGRSHFEPVGPAPRTYQVPSIFSA